MFILSSLKHNQLLCLILDLLPLCLHCPPVKLPPPPPNDGWKQVFNNLTGAIEGDDYLTFGLVDTVDGQHSALLTLDESQTT